MLNQLRQGAQGLTSKVLIGLLVLSFAIWGIGGFQGYGTGTLATVGDSEVTVQEFVNLYDQAQRTAAQSGRRADADQILAQLLARAAVDDEASRYGLGVSSGRVAMEIAKTPQFQGTSGAFDRDRFRSLIMSARMDPDDYIADVKGDLVRNQIAESIGAGVAVPEPMVEAIYRLRNEERTVSFFVVDDQAIEPAGEPTETALRTYFEESKGRFRAPEYRKIALITLDPAALADPSAVSEDELKAEYARRRANYEQPERRRVEQIRFDDAAAAKTALEKVDGGQSFAAVAEESGKPVTDLGLKTKAEFIDPTVANAAFAASTNTAVAVTEAAIEPSLIQVTQIEPGVVTTLEEVEPQLRKELATRNAREALNDLYDQVEDERAGGSTLEEAAQRLSLPYREVEAVARDRKAPDGSIVSGIPDGDQVVREVFESDVGIENSPIRGEGDSWVFFDVLEITAERDRTLDEVRDEVAAAWKAAETESRVAELANTLFERLKAGQPLAALAVEVGKPVQTVEHVKRDASPNELTANAVAQAFAGPEGHIANADGADRSRVILKVDRVVAPAFFAEAEDAKTIRGQLSTALQRDLLTTFNQQLRDNRPVSINNAIYQQVTGQISGQLPLQ
jgi:peptidyl-prolyl cis-trans isomerase D